MKPREEMWAEAISLGDAAAREAARGGHDARYDHKLAGFSALAQAHYLKAIAVQLDGIRRCLVEHAHDVEPLEDQY